MKCQLLYLCLLLSLLLSCETYLPYPVIADQEELLKLECTIQNNKLNQISVSRASAITYERRSSESDDKKLNSSLKFSVNGRELEVQQTGRGSGDRYAVEHEFKSGDVVEVFCTAPGLPDASARTVVPEFPLDIIKDFDVTLEGGKYKGKVTLNYAPDNNLHFTANLIKISDYEVYHDGIFVNTASSWFHKEFSYSGEKELTAEVNQSKSAEYADIFGPVVTNKLIKETLSLEITALSKEQYYGNKHKQSSTMSPSSYSNVKGGLGCVGAEMIYQYGSFTFE